MEYCRIEQLITGQLQKLRGLSEGVAEKLADFRDGKVSKDEIMLHTMELVDGVYRFSKFWCITLTEDMASDKQRIDKLSEENRKLLEENKNLSNSLAEYIKRKEIETTEMVGVSKKGELCSTLIEMNGSLSLLKEQMETLVERVNRSFDTSEIYVEMLRKKVSDEVVVDRANELMDLVESKIGLLAQSERVKKNIGNPPALRVDIKDEDLRRMYVDEKMSVYKIAKALGATQPGIVYRLKKLGLKD